MVQRFNIFHSAPDKSDLLRQFFIELIDYIQNSPGCIRCELWQDQQQSDVFIITEQWQSEDDHRASLANYPQEKMQAAMPLFGQAPTGGYFTKIAPNGEC